MTNKVLGIIPARGGSKTIPRKNVRDFHGQPLLTWSVNAGLDSNVLDRLILTTDDEEIADVGRQSGAEVPFMRPAELAADNSPSVPVFQHAISWLREHDNYYPDYVVLLEPTSPGRRPFHIKEAVELLIATGADSVASMAEIPSIFNPYWQFVVKDEGVLELFTGGSIKQIIRRRQDLPKTYTRNGVVYTHKTDLLFEDEPSIYGEDLRAYITEPKYSLDIDTAEDWIVAEELFHRVLESG